MILNDSSSSNSCSERGEPRFEWRVPARRLEERIRQLCVEVIETGDEGLQPAISELKAALREHNDRLRQLAIANLMRLRFNPEHF